MAGTPILSVPFRLGADGSIASVVEGSDQANAEQLSVIVRTVTGERPMQPGFGLPDPAFEGIAAADIAAQVALWGPAVTVDDISSTVLSATETAVVVDFT